jgi:hypothetical protein
MQPAEHRKLSSPEAASYLGISPSTLSKRRVFGGGPTFLKQGRRVVYDVRDLETYLERCRRSSTSDDGEKRGSAKVVSVRKGRRRASR